MKKLTLILILFALTSFAFCQEEEKERQFIGDSIFSLDSSYLLKGFKNNGWGLGLSYEQIFFDCWSWKGSFSHMTVFPHDQNVVVTTVGISLGTFFYPFFKDFNWLYFGVGSSTDFIQYSNYEKEKDTVINIYPQIGWKQSVKDVVFLDIFYRYNFTVSNEQLPDFAEDLTKQRNEFGIAIKLNFSKILKLLFQK